MRCPTISCVVLARKKSKPWDSVTHPSVFEQSASNRSGSIPPPSDHLFGICPTPGKTWFEMMIMEEAFGKARKTPSADAHHNFPCAAPLCRPARRHPVEDGRRKSHVLLPPTLPKMARPNQQYIRQQMLSMALFENTADARLCFKSPTEGALGKLQMSIVQMTRHAPEKHAPLKNDQWSKWSRGVDSLGR